MLNSYTFASSRSKIKSLYSTINKKNQTNKKKKTKNKSLHTPYSQKKWYFYQKISKMQLFDLNCAILNRYAYESRNMEMINSEVIKN